MFARSLIRRAAPRLPLASFLAAFLTTLAACGGGGGGGGPAAPASLTVDTAPLISAQVLEAIQLNADLAVTSGGATIQSEEGGGAQAQRLRSLARRSIQRAQANAAITPFTLDCVEAGTVRLSGNLADFDTFTAGDVLDSVFTDCDDGFGEVLNGTLRLSVLEFSGDIASELYFFRGDATLTNFRVNVGTEVFTWNGTTRLEIDTLDSPDSVGASLSGARLDVTLGAESRTLFDYAVDLLVDASGDPPVSRLSGTGTLQSSDFTGSVDFVTVFPIETDDSVNPVGGEIEIIGAGNGSIRVVIVDNVNVNLLLDLDGNDVVEQTIATTWASLNGLASGAGIVRQRVPLPVIGQ